jgi:hypothetical protein
MPVMFVAMAPDDTIAEILRTAHESVTAAAVPEALQNVAFEKAVDLAAARAGLAPVAPPLSTPTPTLPHDRPPTGDTPPKTLGRIAEKLGLSPATVGEVFHLDGETLSLGVGTGQLEASKAKGAEQIALLIAAGRQAGEWDAEWTATTEIHPIADLYGKFDSGNFASTIKKMDEVFSFSGNGTGRKVKVRRKGFEQAAALVKKLAGEE